MTGVEKLFIDQGGIIWDCGENFSKFIDREATRVHLTRALGHGVSRSYY